MLKKIGASLLSEPESGLEEPGSHHNGRFCNRDQAHQDGLHFNFPGPPVFGLL
jgi:hypothetical protein